MYPVIRANGETYRPPERNSGSGRPAKYPFAHLEVGDHFEVPSDAHASIMALVSQGRKFGRDHSVGRNWQAGTMIIKRTA